MDEARFKIDSINKNLIVLANEQTKGRGRRGNEWVSPPGNIYCSIALSINLSSKDLFKLTMLTSVAIKRSLEHIGLADVIFKWPNDVYCYNKKISGIIQESYLNKLKKQILIIGIGINFLSSPKNNIYKTTYITEYIKNISLEEYIEIFFNYFFNYFKVFSLNDDTDIILEYKKLQMFLNTNIKIKVNENKIIEGQFIGINDDGSLKLIKDYKKLSIYSGQILL